MTDTFRIALAQLNPVMGDIAADLLLEGGTRRDISRFAIARFTKTD